jgi:hypothetical protein
MITVGYGDIVPVTKPEKIYVILQTMVSSGVYGYFLNTVG